MNISTLLNSLAALVLTAWPVAGMAQSTNNDDGVVKLDTRTRYNAARPGEVLVKFKNQSQVAVKKVNGRFRSACVRAVDQVLRQFGTTDMEQLFPADANHLKRTLRRARSYSGAEVAEQDLSRIYRIRIKSQRPDSTQLMVEQLAKLGEVEYAEPNYLVYSLDVPAATPNAPLAAAGAEAGEGSSAPADTVAGSGVICADPTTSPLYSQQWGIKAMGIDQLWTKPIVNATLPVIAILDTGVDITHPNLKDNIWTNTAEAEGEEGYDDDGDGYVDDLHGWDFINNTGKIADYNMHGTHVAGIAAAANNGLGIVGANPLARIMPVTVMQSDGQGDIATLARGVEYAAAKGATVINMSLGTYADSKVLKNALAKAYQSSVIVASAGNDGLGIYPACGKPVFKPSYPAAYSFVLGVQATEQDGIRAKFSNFDCDGPTYSEMGTDGVNYELSAPGVDIMSTVPYGGYKQLNGTSMSAPLVAGGISALQMVKEYSSQEMLWGDLIHSANFAEAYNITERPAELDLLAMEICDTINGGNGDGIIDAGETIAFYPTLRTTWGEAKNVKLSFISTGVEYEDASLYDVQSQDVDFGYTLSAYAQEKSANPIIVKFKEGIADRRVIRLNLQATADNTPQPLSVEYKVRVYNVVKLGGMITKDMILTPDKHYRVVKDLAIPEGVTLKIEPGTKLILDDGVGISPKGKLIADGEPGKMIEFTCDNGYWGKISVSHGKDSWNSIPDTLRYCVFEGASGIQAFTENCIIRNSIADNVEDILGKGFRSVLEYNMFRFRNEDVHHEFTNILYNEIRQDYYDGRIYAIFPHLDSPINMFNNKSHYGDFNGIVAFGTQSDTPINIKVDSCAYYGTAKESILRPLIYEIGNTMGMESTFAYHDLTNLRKTPVRETHGIVWKVVVDGYDAQDEYDELPPLGVGKHKFEVYFNRPMNVAKAPTVAFGVREPYTQNGVSEEGSWSADSTIYTVYKTITGKTSSDGVNTIYVNDAEDDEYFPCPHEDVRFHINIQAAGSLSTGFMGEAGLGRVNLTWDNTENNFDDFLGYNVYRYTMLNDSTKGEAVRINDFTLDDATTAYTDYDVTPGNTYYYYYKVISTDLKETDPSNIVAVTPQTATAGDANGSGAVDVADVITVVNYSIGQKPEPFIFEAADMNVDKQIDILDIIGIIKNIVRPNDKGGETGVESTATYSIENNTLYVESAVELAGVQVAVKTSRTAEPVAADDLKGFETTSAWTDDNNYLFLAYSMTGKTLPAGKHALLHLGSEAQIESMTLADKQGHNVTALPNGTTAVAQAAHSAAEMPYPLPFYNKLTVPYTIDDEGAHHVHITLTDLTGRTVRQLDKRVAHAGRFAQTFTDCSQLLPGIYLVQVCIDGQVVNTAKVMHK